MSHFTVLVIGNDWENKLAPYHEFECTGIDDEYVLDVDITNEAIESYEKDTTSQLICPNGIAYCKYDDRFYREPTEKEKENIGIGGTGCCDGIIYASQDWGDGLGYRAKVRYVPDGYIEAKTFTSELKSFEDYVEDYYGYNTISKDDINLIDHHKYGYALKEGDTVTVIKRTNPNSKWDWYKLGGRWSGMLKLKPMMLLPDSTVLQHFGFSQNEFENLVALQKSNPDKFQTIVQKYEGKVNDIIHAIKVYNTPVYPESNTGTTGLMGSNYHEQHNKDGYCDQCKVRHLDIEGIQKEHVQRAIDDYNKFNSLVLQQYKGNIVESWDHVREVMFPGDIKSARAYYNNHPFMALCRKHDYCFFGVSPQQKFHLDVVDVKERVQLIIQKALNESFSTYAVITEDGKWHSSGDMGWFGCSSATDEDKKKFVDVFFETFIKPLPKDTLLSIVDCHT